MTPLDTYIQHYENHYSSRDKSAAGTGEYEIKLQMWRDVGYKDSMSVLDYGSGWGAMLPGIKNHKTYIGVDISKTAIDMGREYFPDATFEVMIPGELSLNKTFDIVVAQSVFTHTPKSTTLMCLNDIKKHLKPKGFAIIDVLFGTDIQSDIHVRHYTEDEWQEAIKQAGLKAEFIRQIQWPGGLHNYFKVTK